MDFTMPQPGQGSPVSILNGQNDWLSCKWPAPGSNKMISRGITKNKNKAMIPVIFRLLDTKLFVQLIDLALNNHGSYHGNEKAQKHEQY